MEEKMEDKIEIERFVGKKRAFAEAIRRILSVIDDDTKIEARMSIVLKKR